MKRFLLVLLTFVMLLGLTSCKATCEKDGHVDENTDGVCDVCGEMHVAHFDKDDNGYCDGCKAIIVNYNMPDAVAKILKNNLGKQISKVNSVKIKVEFDSTVTDERWYLEDNQIMHFFSTEVDKGVIDITVSRLGDFVNAKIECYQTEDYNSDDGGDEYSASYETGSTLYFINGKIYEEVKDGLYSEREVVTPQIMELFEKISNISLLNDEDKEAVVNALTKEVVTVLDLKDNKGSVSIDLKPTYDGFKEYVLSLDFDNTTLGMVVTDALQLVDPELTSEELIEIISRVGNLTVTEAYEEIDNYLTENYDTTIQGAYDKIVNDPDVVELIRYVIIERNEYDPENEKDLLKVDEVINAIQKVNVREIIENSEFSEATVYDVLCGFEILPFSLPGKLEDLTGALETLSALTITEFEEAADADVFSMVKEIVSQIEVDALSAKVDINFKNVLELDTINGVFVLDLTEKTKSKSIEDKYDVLRRKENIKFSIYDLSEEPIEIALPEGTGALNEEIFDSTYDGSYNGRNIRVEFSRARFISTGEYVFDIYLTSGDAYMHFSYIPAEVLLEDEIVVPFSYVTYSQNGVISYDENASFRFKISRDYTGNSIEILEFCNFREFTELEKKFEAMTKNNTANGYQLQDGIYDLYYSSGMYHVRFESDFDIAKIEFKLVYSENGDKIECEILSINVNSSHPLKRLDGTAYYGGCDDTETLKAYFNNDLTFEFAFDEETKTLMIVDYPVIAEEYRHNWAE